MNKKIQARFGPYSILATLLTVVACTLRTVATFLGVDAYGYFENGTLFRVSAWMMVATVLLLLTLPLAYRKSGFILAQQTTPHTFLPSLMMGLLFLLFVGEGVFSLVGALFLPTLENLVFLLLLLLGLFSTIYFFSLAILESTENDRKANLGMACVLFFGIYSAYLYLNTEIPRNSHIELCEEVTFLMLMLYFLYEVRISLGKERQNLYVSFSMISGALCAYTVIPTLIYYIGSGKLLASSLPAFLLLAGVFAFVWMRFVLFAKSPVDAPIPLVARLSEIAHAREEEVARTEALYAPVAEEVVEESVEETEQPLEDDITETAVPQESTVAEAGVEPVEVVADEVVSESIEVVADEVISEPVEVVADEVVSEPVEVVADEVISEPVEVIADEVVIEAVETVADEVVIEAVADEVVSEPVEVVTDEVVIEAVETVADEVVSEPVEVVTDEVVSEPVEVVADEVVANQEDGEREFVFPTDDEEPFPAETPTRKESPTARQ